MTYQAMICTGPVNRGEMTTAEDDFSANLNRLVDRSGLSGVVTFSEDRYLYLLEGREAQLRDLLDSGFMISLRHDARVLLNAKLEQKPLATEGLEQASCLNDHPLLRDALGRFGGQISRHSLAPRLLEPFLRKIHVNLGHCPLDEALALSATGDEMPESVTERAVPGIPSSIPQSAATASRESTGVPLPVTAARPMRPWGDEECAAEVALIPDSAVLKLKSWPRFGEMVQQPTPDCLGLCKLMIDKGLPFSQLRDEHPLGEQRALNLFIIELHLQGVLEIHLKQKSPRRFKNFFNLL